MSKQQMSDNDNMSIQTQNRYTPFLTSLILDTAGETILPIEDLTQTILCNPNERKVTTRREYEHHCSDKQRQGHDSRSVDSKNKQSRVLTEVRRH